MLMFIILLPIVENLATDVLTLLSVVDELLQRLTKHNSEQ